jgi:2,4-didehydro-3-deoxy-L-rhamnonate hydrolase
MRLIRFGDASGEKPGVMVGEQRKDVSVHVRDFDRAFFNDGGVERLRTFLRKPDQLPDVPSSARWAAPVARPGKVVCIGLNYADHAKESGAAVPPEPIIFMKAANTVVGPYDDILIPRGSTKTDWEVELGVIIGRDARYLASPDESSKHIAGYCISHDVSERHFQLERGGQWTKGKSCDTFNPIGPWVATPDEVGDVRNLSMSLTVNGVPRQTGSTATMIFNVFHIVHYLSQFMTLEAGDLITTGTPPGVGMGMKPQQFLKVGDVVELKIQGLGYQRSTCAQA